MCGKNWIKNFKSFVMKTTLHISATFDNPDLIESMVERLAYKNTESDYREIKIPGGWTVNDTSSTETYVSGSIEFDDNEEELIKMPFITCFLFTCIREKNEPYILNWSMSLS